MFNVLCDNVSRTGLRVIGGEFFHRSPLSARVLLEHGQVCVAQAEIGKRQIDSQLDVQPRVRFTLNSLSLLVEEAEMDDEELFYLFSLYLFWGRWGRLFVGASV